MNLSLNGLYLQYEKLWKVRKMGRRSMYFASLTKIMGELQLYQTILGILKALTVEYNIENEEVILMQEKRNYCSKFKKGKLKTKKLLKITILDEQKHSVQSADRNKAVQV